MKKKIQTGTRFDNMVEILSGLETGDRVILSPQRKIKDGKMVKIIEE